MRKWIHGRNDRVIKTVTCLTITLIDVVISVNERPTVPLIIKLISILIVCFLDSDYARCTSSVANVAGALKMTDMKMQDMFQVSE